MSKASGYEIELICLALEEEAHSLLQFQDLHDKACSCPKGKIAKFMAQSYAAIASALRHREACLARGGGKNAVQNR